MASYLIYCDAAADIPKEDFAKYDIRMIPMIYMLNGESITFYANGADHDKYCVELFEAQKAEAEVSTTQITPYQYTEIWEKDLQEGNDILYISFSSGMSATYNNAVMAARQLKEDYPDRTIRVVDSLAATSGIGVLTISAAMNRDEKNMSLEENALWLEEHIPYMCHRFVVGDLHYLHKGGRVSKTAAVVGSMLNIKPGLYVDEEGKLQLISKTRGKMAALKKIVDAYARQQGVEGVPKLIFCDYAANAEDVPIVREMLEKVVEPGTRIEFMKVTPIVGAHIGTNLISICGWGKNRKDEG